MLNEECRNYFIQRRTFGVLRKEGSIADVPATADHHQVDCRQSLLCDAGNHIEIAGSRAFHELSRLQLLQTRDLVANARRTLECKRGCSRLYLALKRVHHFFGLALQEQRSVANVLLIIRFRNEPHARAGAALDLIEHARARSIGKHAVLAGSQLKYLLQQRHALAHRACAWERPEIAIRLVESSAMEPQLRKRVPRHAYIR